MTEEVGERKKNVSYLVMKLWVDGITNTEFTYDFFATLSSAGTTLMIPGKIFNRLNIINHFVYYTDTSAH